MNLRKFLEVSVLQKSKHCEKILRNFETNLGNCLEISELEVENVLLLNLRKFNFFLTPPPNKQTS